MPTPSFPVARARALLGRRAEAEEVPREGVRERGEARGDAHHGREHRRERGAQARITAWVAIIEGACGVAEQGAAIGAGQGGAGDQAQVGDAAGEHEGAG